MPCIALGTPVLLIDDRSNDFRFGGLDKFVRKVRSSEYMANYDMFDVNNPPANSDSYYEYRSSLINKCELFTGCKQRKISPLFDISIEERNVMNFEEFNKANSCTKSKEYFTHYLRRRMEKLKGK